MAGTRRKIPIEEKLEKAIADCNRAKARYEAATARVRKIKEKQVKANQEKIMEVILSSGKSFDEIVELIGKTE